MVMALDKLMYTFQFALHSKETLDYRPSATKIFFANEFSMSYTKLKKQHFRLEVTICLIPFLRENFLGEVGHQPSGEKVDNGRIEIPKSKALHGKMSASMF
jgi:hypothetical protein